MVARIDPECVFVTVRRGHFGEGQPGIDGAPETVILDIERVRVGRIGGDMHVVPGTGAQEWFFAAARPGIASIVGTNIAPSSASISAQTVPGFAREAATPSLPRVPLGNPGFRVISCHVSPPSVVRKRPLSSPPELSVWG